MLVINEIKLELWNPINEKKNNLNLTINLKIYFWIAVYFLFPSFNAVEQESEEREEEISLVA